MERRPVLPQYVLRALSMLKDAGYKAYVVGGGTRDFIAGLEPHDYDICTSARPEETEAVFSGFRIIETGLKHGTVTVIIDSQKLELTTFRVESDYSDMRHPDSISFSDNFTDDAGRRDFTMNAIAYSPDCGFIDPFGGIEDIAAKRIRAVGAPAQRFREDALRILRTLRFAAVTGFSIEPETARALRENSDLLREISPERIYGELVKLICGKDAASVINCYFDVIKTVLPELAPMQGFEQHNPHHDSDVLAHTLKALDYSSQNEIIRLAVLFHDCGKPETFSVDETGTGHFYGHARASAEKAAQALTRLRASNEVVGRVVRLVKAHDAPIEAEERIIARRLSSFGERDFFDLLEVMRADCRALAPEYIYRLKHYDDIENIARSLIAKKSCFSIKDLALDGNDLLMLGMKRGPEIGRALEWLLAEVMDKKAENNSEALKALVLQRLSENRSFFER